MNRDQQASFAAALGGDGTVIGVADLARFTERTLTDIAAGLECPRLIVLAYLPDESLLSAIHTIGFEATDLPDLRFSLSAFPAADQALRTGQNRPLTSPSGGVPAPIQQYLTGELVAVPLALGHRRLAVLVGQLAANVSARSPHWQERAEMLAVRGAMIIEMARLSNAYHEERRLRQATQSIIAAILEGRPLAETAAIVTEQIAKRLSEERVGMYLIDAEGGYRPAALRNISPEYAEGVARLRKQTPLSARALATHLPYYTPDVRNEPHVTPALRELFERENIRTILLAMLHHGDQILGTLVVYPRVQRHFTPSEMTLFQALADQATLAVSISRQLETQRDAATLEERNRLAREIHDTVAQSLAGVVMQVEMADTYLTSGDYGAVRSMLSSARAQSRKALEDTRRAVQGLAPPLLQKFSLSQALTEEALGFSADMGIEAPLIVTGEEQPLSDEQRLALLRIAQEALNNARKHSDAQRVRIGLQYGSESAVLVVEDDGKGFDTAERGLPDSAGGYGMFGMEERARLLGGEVQIESTPGWGTRIRAALPFRSARDMPESRTTAAAIVRAPAAGQSRSDIPPDPNAIRVLIADDHAIVRKGLRDILEAQEGVRVVGEAENGAQAADSAIGLRPDVVLMDLQMPEVDGLEGLRRLHEHLPEMPVIVLTTFQTESSVSQALQAGARGYLLKDTAPQDLVAAIRAVHRGDAQFSSAITERLASLASGQGGRSAVETAINEREREVLELLAKGARNKEIAASLFITVSTVEKHIASLFHKLEVSNRVEAVRAAVNYGLLSELNNAAS